MINYVIQAATDVAQNTKTGWGAVIASLSVGGMAAADFLSDNVVLMASGSSFVLTVTLILVQHKKIKRDEKQHARAGEKHRAEMELLHLEIENNKKAVPIKVVK